MVIDMKGRHSDAILAEFLRQSEAVPVSLKTVPVGEFDPKQKLNI